MDLDLAKQSYNISCDHITKLNNKYKYENDLFVNKHFNCSDKIDIDDSNSKNNIKFLKSIYLTNKSCIFKSTEPDDLEWTSTFNNNNDNLKYNDDNVRALFNMNTRQKILTRY
jgi:hypothetical protein